MGASFSMLRASFFSFWEAISMGLGLTSIAVVTC